jgi:hypothetical protein
VFWGGILVAITMAMHGLGMVLIQLVNGDLKLRFEPKPSFGKGLFILILTSWMILLVHLSEVFVWAGFFLWKHAVNSPNVNASLCYYFSLNEYTTLGSNFNLHLRWRLLEGMTGIAGLLTFALSTGVLFTLAQDFQQQQVRFLKQRRTKRQTKLAHASNPPPSKG